MGEKASSLVLHLGQFELEIQQSILVWFGLCILFSIFFYWAGKKIEKADPTKKPTGIVYLSEEMVNLTLYVTEGNLQSKAFDYMHIFGTMIFMMLASNLIGLVGLQNPTSNVSFNGTLALCIFLTVQFQAIKRAGIVGRLKEWCEPFTIMFPINIVGEIAPVISLTMRLFGNMLAGFIITMLVYTLMKATMPWGILGYIATPFLHMYFDIFSGLIQSYIFWTLGSFYLGQQVVPEQE